MHRRTAIQHVLMIILALGVGLRGLGGVETPGASAPEADAAHRGALEAAVASTPALAGARARVQAARERTGAAGRWADPELELMGSRADMVDEDRAMWELTFRQALPKRGERGADRERAAAAVTMAEADFALMAGEMAMDLAMAAAEIDGAERRIELLEKQIARLEAVLGSVDARLAAGVGRLVDRLTVQSQIASMRLMVEEDRRMADDARTDMRARLGWAVEAPLPAYAAPAASLLAADESAAVRLAVAREAEAMAMKSMAQSSARPMTGLGLRLEREQTRMGNEDTVGLAFMTEIPWRSRRYARAERAGRLAATARRLSDETRARLEAEFDSLLRTAAAAGASMGGDSTVLMTVEILEKVTETELQAIDAETQARTARAALWPHVPTASWAATLESNPITTTP